MTWLEWIRPALVDTTEAELLAELRARRAQLWLGDAAAIVTQCVKGPAGQAVHVWLAGGDMAGVLALRPGVEAWGRGQGCEFLTINGRSGWARVLGRHGYRDVDGELRKDL